MTPLPWFEAARDWITVAAQLMFGIAGAAFTSCGRSGSMLALTCNGQIVERRLHHERNRHRYFCLDVFSEPHGYNFNGYLVRHAEGNLCIDPVPPSDESLADIARMGVARILLTNRNHSRAANVIRERTGARTFIHPDDAAHARSQGAEIDGDLSVGTRIGPLSVVAVPGKSPGEVAFHWPERKLLIVGDAVIGNPPGHCGLLREKVMDDPARLKQSVRKLLDLDFDLLLFGDGTSILHDAKMRLTELTDTFLGA
jgi:glyoxylase-like metal-dependent hydrolase (beta-lactamase superfamily II)